MTFTEELKGILNPYMDKVEQLQNNHIKELENIEKNYTGELALNKKASERESYNTALNDLRENAMDKANALMERVRSKVADIATRTLTDSELRDLGFIEAHKGDSAVLAPSIVDMYAKKHSNSFLFMQGLVEATGIKYDNVWLPINLLDKIQQGVISAIRTAPTDYANRPLKVAVFINDRVGIYVDTAEIDKFLEVYHD